MVPQLLLAALVAYLVGGLPSGLIVGKRLQGIDVRRVGSGMTGATNTLRALGWKASVLVFLLDAGKGALAVLLVRWLFIEVFQAPMQAPAAEATAALAAVIGHNWSPYIRFSGGRGVSTSFGTLLAVWPPMAFVALATFAIVLLVTRFASLASLAAVGIGALAIVPGVLSGRFPGVYLAWAALAVAIVYFQHRDNILRLLQGNERKLGSGAVARS
jgi:glycerol-3-phosphate acyltransferase PlsY